MDNQAIKILLVEDNEGDIILTTEALSECRVKNEVKVLRNGSDALNFLMDCTVKNKHEMPHLILLDINLPKKNGHEVLQSAKNHPDLRHIPIIILTTSASEIDILKAYQAHANSYIIKPLEVADFMTITNKIEQFWFSIAKLPTN
ncbi:response regulator [Algoriphagus litoralis]|uniref:response regulator n=1 Tax=Algoriphagus litoralis TaxID=2202829 RepID=UPI000DB98FE5|nr:response regulator [Algoriphagus litoralis]